MKDPIEETLRLLWKTIQVVLWSLFVLGIIALCTGCASHRCGIGDTLWIHDTVRCTAIRYDSINIHDSIFCERVTEGETIYVTKDRWHTAFRDRTVHDTTYISKCDTIAVEVEREMSTWESIRLRLSDIVLLVTAIFLLIFAVRRKIGI